MLKSMYTTYSNSSLAWDAMYEAISNAKKSVYLEIFILVDDEAGRRFFEILEKKASEGVDVKLIVDSWGSFGISRKAVASIKKAGVDLHFFSERKHKYRGFWKKLISRTHRKILIIDESVGFIGGVNVQALMKDWLDMHVRIEGNAVHSLLRAFAKMYIICGGEKENVKYLLKYKFRVQQDLIDFIYDDAGENRSRARAKYIEALVKARERVLLFCPYYFPDKKFLYALWKARQRGIRVDLLIPYRADVRIATYAGYGLFSLMQKLGVRVHLTDKMMHGKGVVMDDSWAMVGSSNIDQLSFFDNYEANVRIHDKEFVSKIKNTVLGWMGQARNLDDLSWEKRGRWQKLKEWTALGLYRIWFRDAGILTMNELRKLKKNITKNRRGD